MASEIRVDKITSLSGVGTISPSPTGVEIAGITTAATLKATTGIVTTLTATTGIVTTFEATTGNITTLRAPTGIVTSLTTNTLTANSTTKVGSGVTLSPDGDVFATGITTVGSRIDVISSQNTLGILSSTDGGANLDLFDDDTQSRIRSVDGRLHLYSDFLNNVSDSSIRFFIDGNNEKVRIASDGNVGIGTENPATPLDVNGTATVKGAVVNNGSITMNSSHLQFSGQLSLPNVGATIFRPVADTIAFGINNGQRVSVNQHGLLFGTDTAFSNALDDYEEGDWTPTFVGASGSITVTAYAVQYGKYVKIGKMVYVEGLLRANVTNNSNGTYDIDGLPFTVANTANASGIIHAKEQSSWTVAPHHFSCIVNSTRAKARGGIDVGDNSYTNGNTSGFNSGSSNNNRVYIAGSYRAEG